MRAYCAIQRCGTTPGQAIPPFNKRIGGPTNGRLPHPQAIEMGSPFVIGRDGTRVVIFRLETVARRTSQ
jgi:hypothetical protein